MLLPQVPPQELGAPVGPGLPVGLAVGDAVGEPVDVAVAVGDAVAVNRVNDRVQAPGVGDGVISAACGILDGTLGATEVDLNW